MKISNQYTLHIGHRIGDMKSRAQNLHGHTYTLTVCIQGKIDKKTGIIFDMDKLSQIINKTIIEKLDHCYIYQTGDNIGELAKQEGLKVQEVSFPTSIENMGAFLHHLIQKKLKPHLKNGTKLSQIMLNDGENTVYVDD